MKLLCCLRDELRKAIPDETNMTQDARDRQNSQRAIEALLGRMLTDDVFRQQFMAEPENACAEYGFDLTAAEIAPLLEFDSHAIGTLAKRLDPRIVRAASTSRPRSSVKTVPQIQRKR